MSEQTITKRCSKCKEIKPFSEFHKNRTRKDGHQHRCKFCKHNTHMTYWQTGNGKSNYKRYIQSKAGKKNHKQANLKYYNHFPERRRAHTAVSNAVRLGKLPRPDILQCYYCFEPAEEYHHWHGYEPKHWLDVIPICIKCHRLFHSNYAASYSNLEPVVL